MSYIIDVITIVFASVGFWTFLTELINRKSGISKRLDDVDNALKDAKKEQQQFEARQWRNQIVRFNDELLNQVKHSTSMFETILISCSDYEKYCKKDPDFRNGVATEAIANIRRCYRKCEEEKDFL